MKDPAILVVDDEPNTRMGVAYTLQEWGGSGAVIEMAENGTAALDRLRTRHFDLLITDIRMPVMDGIKLLETVRADNNGIRCIMLTGFAEFDYAQSAIRLGVLDYLLKPIQQDQLLQAVVKVLSVAEADDAGQVNDEEGQVSAELSNPAIRKAVQYIHEHIHEVLPIKVVAGHVHLNASYFSVLFKEEMGVNFIDYVTEYRLKKAKELLVNSDLGLDEISEQIGYQTTSYFIKLFKKHEQMTPKHYRDLTRKRSMSDRL